MRSRIPAYADYGDEDARHLVDKQVRAYVGEALSLLRERCGAELAAGLAEDLERVLMMCEFTNQQLIAVLDHARLSEITLEELHDVDHDLISTADRAGDVDVAALEAYLVELDQLFARRAKAVRWLEDRR
ncbi:MAG: hypothetical protein ACRENA_13890 [Vulcanimicrobiaceae bacterium]